MEELFKHMRELGGSAALVENVTKQILILWTKAYLAHARGGKEPYACRQGADTAVDGHIGLLKSLMEGAHARGEFGGSNA